jgi:hypothetical protein
MGYDSRLYVIRKTDAPIGDDGKFKYAELMAVYEMCVFPPFQKLFDKASCPATKYALCGTPDADIEITEDMYGDLLRERSLDEVIECLDQIIALDDDTAKYARVRPLLALLQEYRKIQNNWYRLAVLHYGH